MTKLEPRFHAELESIKAKGLYKQERIITTPQGVRITTQKGGEVLNFVTLVSYMRGFGHEAY